MNSTWNGVPVVGRCRALVALAAFLFLVVPMVASLPAQAGADEWTALGPEGGEVLALLTHPVDAEVVFAGTSGGGVFVSRDGGGTWALAGQRMLVARVEALAMAQVPGAPLYAGTDQGVFRLEEGAADWESASVGLPSRPLIGSLVVDPADPLTLFATVRTGSWNVYRSQDGGQSWSNVGGGRGFLDSLAVAATTPTSIYLGSFDGIYRSRDGGTTWIRLAAGLPDSIQVNGLLADPVTPTTMYASIRELNVFSRDPISTVFKSVDGGVRWEDRGAGLPSNLFGSPTVLAINPGSPGTLYVGYSGEDGGVHRSTDGASSWQAVNSAPADLPIQALAVQPANGAVFAGSSHFWPEFEDVGVLRSLDEGQNWTSETSGLNASFITHIVPGSEDGGPLVVSTESQGILASDDGGSSWRSANDGIADPWVGLLTQDPHTPSTLYTVVGESRFPLTQLYRSTDFADSWQPLGPRFDGHLVSLAVDGSDASILYLVSDGQVYRSTTTGTEWTEVSGQVCGGSLTVVAHPTMGGRLLGGCVEDSGAPVSPPIYVSFLLASSDGGSSWNEVLDGGSGVFFGDWTFTFDQGAPSTVFAALAGFAGGRAYRSDDGGSTWSEMDGLQGRGAQVLLREPTVAPSTLPREIYAGTLASGVLRSVDDGRSWTPFNEGLTGGNVKALAFDPLLPDRIWAGNLGAGVHALDHLDRARCVATGTSQCLLGRFQVEVEWENFRGVKGLGRTVPLPDVAGSTPATTGVFWFFREDNPELAVKVLDGRQVNGNFWVFYSGLSTVRYKVTVTDVLNGRSKIYENPPGALVSAGDNRAFPGLGGSGRFVGTSPAPIVTDAGPGLDPGGDASLFLLDSRFRVDVKWDHPDGGVGVGTGVPLTSRSGALWFFRPNNLEVFVKVLDGRPVNGHYWLFFGSLTNLGFELTITDTQSDATRTYVKPPGAFSSLVDVMAF